MQVVAESIDMQVITHNNTSFSIVDCHGDCYSRAPTLRRAVNTLKRIAKANNHKPETVVIFDVPHKRFYQNQFVLNNND